MRFQKNGYICSTFVYLWAKNAPLDAIIPLSIKLKYNGMETIKNDAETVLPNDGSKTTGKDTFSGIGDQKWKSAEAILAYAAGIPRERQQEVLSALSRLGQIGGNTAAAFLQEWIGKKGLLEKKPGTAPAAKLPDAEPFSG